MDRTELKISVEKLIGQLEDISAQIDEVEGNEVSKKEASEIYRSVGDFTNDLGNLSWELSQKVFPKIELNYEDIRN